MSLQSDMHTHIKMCTHTLNIHKHNHLLSKCLWREISVYSFQHEKLELIPISQYPHLIHLCFQWSQGLHEIQSANSWYPFYNMTVATPTETTVVLCPYKRKAIQYLDTHCRTHSNITHIILSLPSIVISWSPLLKKNQQDFTNYISSYIGIKNFQTYFKHRT